jgi:L-fuculose-phosphate aldolase
MILSQFQIVGRDLFTSGIVSPNSRNLSIKLGDRLTITRRGCRLGCIKERDLIETGISKNDSSTLLASSELAVHRAIYQTTTALAIIHAHPSHTVALSLTETAIVPTCVESLSKMGRVPIVGWNMEMRQGEMADIIAQALTQHRIVMVCGHGSFAIDQLLEEAYRYTTILEESSRDFRVLKSLKD